MAIFSRGARPNEKVEDSTKLSQQEIEFLLNTLKTTTLVGEQVEMFYTMVWKLQEQYLQLQDKK
jgi:hypothetical protein